MTTQEKESICLVALSAAFSDGAKSESERAQFRGLLDQLELPNAAQLVSRALLTGATSPADDVAELRRQLETLQRSLAALQRRIR